MKKTYTCITLRYDIYISNSANVYHSFQWNLGKLLFRVRYMYLYMWLFVVQSLFHLFIYQSLITISYNNNNIWLWYSNSHNAHRISFKNIVATINFHVHPIYKQRFRLCTYTYTIYAYIFHRYIHYVLRITIIAPRIWRLRLL